MVGRVFSAFANAPADAPKRSARRRLDPAFAHRNSGGNRKSAMFASSCTPALLINMDVER